MSLLTRYRSLNASFRPVLVWHLGVDAGFFAEYSAMIGAMIYCLEHHWQFRLYSRDATFGVGRGWTDFFEPFCEEETAPFHHRYNLYASRSWREIWHRPAPERKRLAKWKLKLAVLHAVGNVKSLLTYHHRVRLSHNVHFDATRHIRIPELDIDGDYCHAFSRMVEITWHFNAETAAVYERLKAELKLPADYVGCQLRGGDKVTEAAPIAPEQFAARLQREAPDAPVFVLSDDYALYRRFVAAAPTRPCYTLCQPTEAGYVNSQFRAAGGEGKRQQMQRFLTSMQLLKDSSLFLGSITPGPSLFLLKLRLHAADARLPADDTPLHADDAPLPADDAHSQPAIPRRGLAIDCPPERIYEATISPVAHRSEIADETLHQ